MMKTPARPTLIRSSSFAEALSTPSRKTKWSDPHSLEGSQSLRFANAWKSQLRMLRVKGIWNDVTTQLKRLYASLTDEDLLLKQGEEENLMGRLQQKLGMTSHEIRRLIASL
ncbi:MAG: CsbD family protein [Ignavibacteriae bacterium]|nr:CsbD family protein [Ignavibacteriota bacterium]